MKPKFDNKPYSERQELPSFVRTTRGHDKVRYGEVWKSYNNDFCKIFTKDGNVQTIFASLGLCNPGSTEGTKTESSDGKSKRHEVEAIIQTYSELKAFTTPHAKKSGNLAELESAIKTATLNSTTANVDDCEKLKQKLETIEEVPLVEADPDIIKPPRTSGPNVMNITQLKGCEEETQNSDFQIGEDGSDVPVYSRGTKNEAAPNYIKNYFDGNEEEAQRKPNFNEMITLNAVPEINAKEELSLKELMERVRQRNRLLRCRDIDQQLNTTGTTMDDKNRPQPHHNPPTIQPGWGWPAPQYPGYKQPPTYPYVSNPTPQKSEPLTPDNRPGHYRATKVNPINLALHLGPLINAFKNAGILFPLLTLPFLLPKTGSEELQRNFCCALRSVFEREMEDRSDIVKVKRAKFTPSCQIEVDWTPKLSKAYFTVLRRTPDMPRPFPENKPVLATQKLFDFKNDIIYFSTFINDIHLQEPDLSLEADADDKMEDNFYPTARIPFDVDGNWLETQDDKYLFVNKETEQPGNNDQNV